MCVVCYAMLGYLEQKKKWVWDRINGSVFGVKVAAIHLLTDWKEAYVKDEARTGTTCVGDRSWTKPADGWMKINVDVAVFQDGSTGIGTVIWNAQAGFAAASYKQIEGAWKLRKAEAMGRV